ncbi:hypothetical protein AWN76_013175 [Rhodothermaceae bacterium RA]|nr:hypothetical protein AWN76_013175 [Rhodothermaceae bacterium RA]
MRVALLGSNDLAAWQARAVAAWPGGAEAVGPADVAPHDRAVLADVLARSAVLVIHGAPADRFRLAEAAARHGCHLLLAWPPAASIPEAEALVRLAEEAGVEIGVQRPLRWQPALRDGPPALRPSLVLLQQDVPDGRPWPRLLADAVDLCTAVAGGGGVRRVEAAAVRRAAHPEAMAFTLRFLRGTLAQVSLRRGPVDRASLYAAGPGGRLEVDFSGMQARLAVLEARQNEDRPDALETETAALVTAEVHAFLDALAARQPAPVSILEALQTMRLVERLMQRLR